MNVTPDQETFAELVEQALESLPEDITGMLNNVEIVVEAEPPEELLRGMGPGHTLLGLYQGVPLTKRGVYDRALPDRIAIYQGPITRMARTPERIRAQVRRTVLHEIGHHFGIEEERLHELGWG